MTFMLSQIQYHYQTSNSGQGVSPIMVMMAIVVLITIVLAPLPYFIARGRKHSHTTPILVLGIAGIFFQLLWVAALVWAFMEDNAIKPWDLPDADVDEHTASDDVNPSAPMDGPGDYMVAGVDTSTLEDVELVIQARSQANAQAKAELQGIKVTACTMLQSDDQAD